MNGIPISAAGTPDRLKAAARRCIAEHGFSGASSRRITEMAGANLAAITYHFGSKDELVAAALIEGIRDWLAPTLAVLAVDGDPGERTMSAVAELLRSFEANRGFAPAYLQALARAPIDPDIAGPLMDLWGELRTAIATDIRVIQSAGHLGDWIDPDLMAMILVAIANGLLVQAVVQPDGFDATGTAAQVAALLLAARTPS